MIKTIDALEILGTDITTSYQYGDAIPAGLATQVTLQGEATTKAASNSTSAQFVLEGSDDGTNGWTAVGVLDLTAAAPAIALSLTKNTGSSVWVPIYGRFDGTFRYLRVGAKFTGGAGKANEALTARLALVLP